MTKRSARKLAQDILYGISFRGDDIFDPTILSAEVLHNVGADDYLDVYNAAQSLLAKVRKILGR